MQARDRAGGVKQPKRKGKSTMKKAIVTIIAGLAVVAQVHGESAQMTGGASSFVSFAPGQITRITHISATSDKAGSLINVYDNGGLGAKNTVTAPTNGQTIIYLSNVTNLATNDVVIYVHADRTTIKQSTVSVVGTNSVTLAAGITKAGAIGDQLHEMTSAFPIPLGAATKDISGPGIYESPNGSPVYIVVDATTTSRVAVTVRK